MNCSRCGIYTCPSERTDTVAGMLCKGCLARMPMQPADVVKMGGAVPHVMAFDKLLQGSAKTTEWSHGKDFVADPVIAEAFGVGGKPEESSQ
jgi:hypothetical protein